MRRSALVRGSRLRAISQEAHDILAPRYAVFTKGVKTADLKQAKALLEELK